MSGESPELVDEQLDFLEDAQRRFQSWIQLADAKAGAVLVILGLMATNLISKSDRLSRAVDAPSGWGTVATWAFWLACVAAAVSVVLVSLALFPRTKAKTKSLAFFANVATYKTAADYLDAVKKKDVAGLRKETANQVWELARVASWKFAFLKRAYFATLIFLVLAAAARVALRWSGV